LQADGSTLRENLLSAEKRGARRHPWMVVVDDAPTGLAYLFEIFAELSVARRHGMNGPDPIGFDQMYFWQLNSGFRLRGWERKLLVRVDAIWRRAQHKDYTGPKLDEPDGD
jgi:hypothetical protein